MKLMVIDGNSIVNRAFYGVSQNLTTRDGFPTNAIFGFLNILMKLDGEEKPDEENAEGEKPQEEAPASEAPSAPAEDEKNKSE